MLSMFYTMHHAPGQDGMWPAQGNPAMSPGYKSVLAGGQVTFTCIADLLPLRLTETSLRGSVKMSSFVYFQRVPLCTVLKWMHYYYYYLTFYLMEGLVCF